MNGDEEYDGAMWEDTRYDYNTWEEDQVARDWEAERYAEEEDEYYEYMQREQGRYLDEIFYDGTEPKDD